MEDCRLYGAAAYDLPATGPFGCGVVFYKGTLSDFRIRVPEKISVVGNDDIPFSRHTPVKLTTIHAPLFELGRKAAEILIRNIESNEPLPIENVVLHAELVVRESTTALRSTPVGQHQEIPQN